MFKYMDDSVCFYPLRGPIWGQLIEPLNQTLNGRGTKTISGK